MSQRIILVRHGETAVNANNKTHIYEDLEILNSTGIEQMKKTSLELKQYLPFVLYCSSEERAKHSANIISQELGISFETIKDMQERNWGGLSGKPWPEIKMILDQMTLGERRRFVPNAGESWEQFETRLIGGVNWALERNPDRTFTIVTHGGVITVLMPYLLDGSKEEALKPSHMFDNASITIFDRNEKGFTQILLNDTSHLRQALVRF